MIRLVLACLVILVAGYGADPAPDPAALALERAVAKHKAELAEVREAMTKEFDRREAAARQKGDKKAIDKIKGEREQLRVAGQMPGDVPPAIAKKLQAARQAAVAAHEAAIRAFTRSKQDAAAADAERAIAALRAPGVGPELVGVYKVVNKHSGLCLGAADASKADGAPVVQNKDDEKPHQEWDALAGPAGSIRLRNRHSGRMLAVLNADKNPGGPIVQAGPGGDAHFCWVPDKAGESVRLRSLHSGHDLGVASGSKDPGARLIQWNRSDTDDQLWQLVELKPAKK